MVAQFSLRRYYVYQETAASFGFPLRLISDKEIHHTGSRPIMFLISITQCACLIEHTTIIDNLFMIEQFPINNFKAIVRNEKHYNISFLYTIYNAHYSLTKKRIQNVLVNMRISNKCLHRAILRKLLSNAERRRFTKIFYIRFVAHAEQ